MTIDNFVMAEVEFLPQTSFDGGPLDVDDVTFITVLQTLDQPL